MNISDAEAIASLRRADGSWDLTLILDQRGLSPVKRKKLAHLKTLAHQAEVPCRVGWEGPPPEVQCLCIVGHSQPDLKEDFDQWGEKGWLRDRWLFLFVCGQTGAPPFSTKELNFKYGVMGVTASVHNIDFDAAVEAVERLLRKLHSGEQGNL